MKRRVVEVVVFAQNKVKDMGYGLNRNRVNQSEAIYVGEAVLSKPKNPL